MDIALHTEARSARHLPERRKRVAVYAYSARPFDLSRQTEACRRHARRLGTPRSRIAVFRDSDRGVRPMLSKLLESVGRFDMIVVEDPDRLSRDLRELGCLTAFVEGSGTQIEYLVSTEGVTMCAPGRGRWRA